MCLLLARRCSADEVALDRRVEEQCSRLRLWHARGGALDEHSQLGVQGDEVGLRSCPSIRPSAARMSWMDAARVVTAWAAASTCARSSANGRPAGGPASESVAGGATGSTPALGSEILCGSPAAV